MNDTDPRLERIESKLDKVVDHIGTIDSTLAAQHESLKDHIRRTEILEQEIKPIKTHDTMATGALKLICLAFAMAGALEGIVALLTYLRK